MDLSKFETQIRKTGFDLESKVAQQLRNAGWTVISNKYYVDDFEESVREIDLVAYQVSKVQHLDLYTTLIISCKKSDANVWALLARDINLKDPNSDWWPLHSWTNDKALNYRLAQAGTARRYHDEVSKLGVAEALRLPAVEIFAFQEMDRNTGAPQNDRPIFNAVTSLVKAQAYELSALPLRKKARSVYQLNLLSVVDADLVRLTFSGTNITAAAINTEHYISRYIVRKKETFSRIRFVKADAFQEVLTDYGHLHLANCKWFGKERDLFYDGVVENWERAQVLFDDFKKEVNWVLRWRIERQLRKVLDASVLSLSWKSSTKCLAVSTAPLDKDALSLLNNDEEVRSHVAEALKKIYRYEGPFILDDDDIPF